MRKNTITGKSLLEVFNRQQPKEPRGEISRGLKDHRRSVKKDLYPQNRLTTKGDEGYSKSECIEEMT